jgi:hypothetical protein
MGKSTINGGSFHSYVKLPEVKHDVLRGLHFFLANQKNGVAAYFNVPLFIAKRLAGYYSNQ